jgi:hypothetical protein
MEVKACSSHISVSAPGVNFFYDIPQNPAGSLTTARTGA